MSERVRVTGVDTSYFKLDKDDVVALSLKNEHGEVQLAKADGSWTLLGGRPDEKLKTTAVDSLVSSAASVTLNAPVGTEVKADYQLENPAALLTVVTEKKVEADKEEGDQPANASADEPSAAQTSEGEAAASQPSERVERKTHVLRIGGKQGDDGYYAKSDASSFVVRLATWTADTFLKKKRSDLLEQKKDDKKKPQAKTAGTDGSTSGS
jgi:hypothetical protein